MGRRSLSAVGRFVSGLGVFERGALAVLLATCLSSAAAPTAVGILYPESYQSIWSIRPVGPANVLELALVFLALVWLAGAVRRTWCPSYLDLTLAAIVSLVLVLHLLATARGPSLLAYEQLDAERVLLVLAGYFVASRLRVDQRELRIFVWIVALSLLAHFGFLTLLHGLIGATYFGTMTGREALLITEDVLLVAVALVPLFGLIVDGLSRRKATAVILVVVAAVVFVDILSLRRGALIFLLLALAIRGVPLFRKMLQKLEPTRLSPRAVAFSLAALIALTASVAVLAEDVSYTVRSITLQTDDSSSRQRTAELESFAGNLDAAGFLVGRGLGSVWNAESESSADIAAFGSGETAYVRVGWHVYGLDWLYKLGLLGVAGVVSLLAAAAVRGWDRLRALRDRTLRSVTLSLAIVAPVLLLFAFTNLRLAFFAGVVLGLASRALDLAADDSDDASTTA